MLIEQTSIFLFKSLGLASALSDTNHNLHTFEFMLGQYRQMAKISPFLVKASEEASSKGSLMSKSESNLAYKSNEDVIQELKVLSETISKMKVSSDEASQLVTNEADSILKTSHAVSKIVKEFLNNNTINIC